MGVRPWTDEPARGLITECVREEANAESGGLICKMEIR